jgi:hypothetical protein
LYENLSAKSAKSRIGPVELQIGDRVILLTSGDNSTAGTVVENGPKGKVRVRFDDLSTETERGGASVTVISIGDYRGNHRLRRARGVPDWQTCEKCGRLTETLTRTELAPGARVFGPGLCEECDIADQIAENVAKGYMTC